MSTTTNALQRHAKQSKPRHRVRKWVKRIALGLVAIGAIAGIVYAWLPSPVVVDVSLASRTKLAVEVDEDGQTRVRDRFVVAAPTSGNLERIEIEAGRAVVKGDRIAQIDPPDPALLDRRSRDEAKARLAGAIARLHRADTTIARARATRDLAVREAASAKDLAARGAIGGVERDRLELQAQISIRDVAAAETERTAAAAEIAGIRAILGDNGAAATHTPLTVTAPTAGKILRVIRDSAGPVAIGAPLVEIGDPEALEVVIDVLSSSATQIRPGMEVAIENWGGDPLTGHVRMVEPSAFTRISSLGVEEQRVKVLVDIDKPPGSLGDGFRVDARIFLWRGTDVLAVPASAVFRDHDRWAVYAIEDGRARLRPVELGHRGRTAVEITGGISDGTPIILHPSDRVVDGVHVTERDAD